jgi:hypothetical protein
LTLNLPSVALRKELANTSGVPNKVSKDLGKLETKRQFKVGKLCASDGAVNAAAPAPIVAFFKKERLCIVFSSKIVFSYLYSLYFYDVVDLLSTNSH